MIQTRKSKDQPMAVPGQQVCNRSVGKRLLDAAETAAYLGLSVDTVYRKARMRELPSVKVGGALRFDIERLNAFIEQHATSTLD